MHVLWELRLVTAETEILSGVVTALGAALPRRPLVTDKNLIYVGPVGEFLGKSGHPLCGSTRDAD